MKTLTLFMSIFITCGSFALIVAGGMDALQSFTTSTAVAYTPKDMANTSQVEKDLAPQPYLANVTREELLERRYLKASIAESQREIVELRILLQKLREQGEDLGPYEVLELDIEQADLLEVSRALWNKDTEQATYVLKTKVRQLTERKEELMEKLRQPAIVQPG